MGTPDSVMRSLLRKIACPNSAGAPVGASVSATPRARVHVSAARKSVTEAPSFRSCHQALRSLSLKTCGAIRTAEFRGRQNIVVPVVALREGVIHASNSETPELVLASEFSQMVGSWNGRPVMMNHPVIDGENVSANEPSVLDGRQLGAVYLAHIEDDALKMEAWLDPELVAGAGEEAERLLGRIQSGETVDVSVGVLVSVEEKIGSYGGVGYSGIWHSIVPDHLAMLPEGVPGACSQEMGCGAPRTAASVRTATIRQCGGNKDKWCLYTKDGSTLLGTHDTREEAIKQEQAIEAHKNASGGKMTLKERLAAIRKRFATLAQEPDGAVEGTSSDDIRSGLWSALYAAVPAFGGIVEVYQDTKTVIYSAGTDDCLWARTFSLGADGDDVTLNDDAVQVERVVEFQPVGAETPSADPALVNMSAAASGCGCGGKKTAAEERTMNKKKELIAKILALAASPFKAGDESVLEGFSEERLKTLSEIKAPEPEPEKVIEKEPEAPTREKFLAAFPDVKEVLEREARRNAARKTELVASLKDTKVFSEEELQGQSIESLEKLVALSGKKAPTKVLDFSGQGVPRPLEGASEEIPKPPDVHAAIRASRGIK